MSFVSELKSNPLVKIAERLAVYETLIKAAEPLFEMEGVRLEDLCKQHARDLADYTLILQECKTIEHYLQTKAEETEGQLYRKYIESGARALGAKELQMYVKSDPEFVEQRSMMIDVEHIRRSLEAVVEALEAMGWSVSNIVKLRVAEKDHIVL